MLELFLHNCHCFIHEVHYGNSPSQYQTSVINVIIQLELNRTISLVWDIWCCMSFNLLMILFCEGSSSQEFIVTNLFSIKTGSSRMNICQSLVKFSWQRRHYQDNKIDICNHMINNMEDNKSVLLSWHITLDACLIYCRIRVVSILAGHTVEGDILWIRFTTFWTHNTLWRNSPHTLLNWVTW